MTGFTPLSPVHDCEDLFAASDADILLVSGDADLVEFRVHRCILSAASSFFRHMFTLPQPEACATQKESDIPRLTVAEPCTTIDPLLRLVYPVPDPVLSSLDELAAVLGAAVKYDFHGAIYTLRKLLVSPHFLEPHPTRVFAIASRFDFEEEARIASRYTLNINVIDCPLSEELKHITAYSYHRLLDLHRRRAQAAQDLLKVADDVACMQCNGSQYSVVAPPKWWYEFVQRARKELAERPTTDVIFSMKFLSATAAATGCQRCPGSILDSYKFLDELKREIDALPATI